jgi:ArsR family transcriptional regulator
MEQFLSVAKAMSDRSRVRALMFLRGGELCLCQIIEMLGLAPSTVSKHMAVLQRAGLVRARREGRWINYGLAAGDASASARLVLRWAREVLTDEPQVVEDDTRLKQVLAQDKERLCAHYRR